VAELRFAPEADQFLSSLESDLPRSEILLGKVNTALDRLETDPGDAWCRRRRFQNIGVWGISIVHEDKEWLILWEPGEDDSVAVRAIVPAP
jgi:hypothetical protein